jgi:hypothetical protein
LFVIISHESKPGYLTTEFWVLLFINIMPEVGAIDVGNTKLKGALHVLTVVAYMLSRGIAKAGQPVETAPVLNELPADVVDQGDAGKP